MPKPGVSHLGRVRDRKSGKLESSSGGNQAIMKDRRALSKLHRSFRTLSVSQPIRSLVVVVYFCRTASWSSALGWGATPGTMLTEITLLFIWTFLSK